MTRKNNPEHFWDFVNKKSDEECWEWLGSHSVRYGRFTLLGKKYPAHRFSYFLFTGYMPLSTEYVCHICDNIYCVNPNHLFLGNQFDNMRDMVNKGRNFDTKGENNGRSIMTKEEVIEMRALYSSGKFSYKKLSKRFGIGMTQTARILKKESWSWV